MILAFDVPALARGTMLDIVIRTNKKNGKSLHGRIRLIFDLALSQYRSNSAEQKLPIF